MPNEIQIFPRTTQADRQGAGRSRSQGADKAQPDSVVRLSDRPGGAEATPARASAPGAKDTVKLTKTADQIRSLSQLGRETPDVDLKKVERIKRALAAGHYPLDLEAAAGNMLGLSALLDRPAGKT